MFGSANFAFNSVFLQAINYAVQTDKVNVLNESFGANPFPDEGSLDLDRMADQAAVAAGVTVTVSTGDAAPTTNTIGSPGTDPAVIVAGATTSYRAYAQTGIGGINFPGVNGWLNNNISALSSAGFTQSGSTVDVVAPGDLNWALCSPLPQYVDCTDFNGNPASIELQGGTSEASPLTAGVAALVIQAYEQGHGGTAPTPAVVKRIIMSTAEDVSRSGRAAGSGNARRVRRGPGRGLLRQRARSHRSRPAEERSSAERGRLAGRARVLLGDRDQRRQHGAACRTVLADAESLPAGRAQHGPAG